MINQILKYRYLVFILLISFEAALFVCEVLLPGRPLYITAAGKVSMILELDIYMYLGVRIWLAEAQAK